MIKKNKAPIYKTVTGKYGQYFINVEPLKDEKRIEIFKASDTSGTLKPIGEVQVPDKVEQLDGQLRPFIIKELRKLENYIEARETYAASGVKAASDDLSVQDLGSRYIDNMPSYQEQKNSRGPAVKKEPVKAKPRSTKSMPWSRYQKER